MAGPLLRVAIVQLAFLLVGCVPAAEPGTTPVRGAEGPSRSLVSAPAGCRSDDIRSQIEAFLAAVNRGDRPALSAAMSPAFRGFAIGSPDPRSGLDRNEAIQYFVERSALGERFSFAAISVSPYLTDGNVGFEVTIYRELNKQRLRYLGKGAVYCGPSEAHGIIVLAFGDAEP